MVESSMGSNPLISEEEAASLMGVQRRVIKQLEKKGMLLPKSGSSPPAYYAVEVAALHEIRCKKPSPKKTATLAAQAYATTRSFDRRLADLENLVRISARRLPIDEESVMSLYLRAADALEELPESSEEVLEWSKIYLGIHEEWLDLLEAYTDDSSSWEVFHRLCLRIEFSAPEHRFGFDKELEAAFGYFKQGAVSFKNVVHYYLGVRFGHTTSTDVLYAKPEDVDEQLLALMAMYKEK